MRIATRYYGDPAFVQTPGEGLLSKEYAKERAKLIDPKHASRAFVAGNPLALRFEGEAMAVLGRESCRSRAEPAPPDPERVSGAKDTTHISIIDKDGNIFDSTPSGGWIGGAVISRRHGHRHERARRAVLARQDARRATAARARARATR